MTTVGNPTRFVATVVIRRAVAGRETEVLEALGINWRAGRPHIECPYPDHCDDNPSWRWDARKSRAVCTCTNGDGIFDVVAKMEGSDFEAAKIRVAELLNRHDLIQYRDEGGQWHQATDSASLLNAPADRRDDSLPLAYLARRLGIPAEGVPIPSTPVVGLKALAYFDPPPGSKAKPKLLGRFPCAVFGTVAADGGTHGHRIYLAPDAGKADLGIGPDGRPRDPKKSAKALGGDNTAGRSVLWGDAACAPHIIVAEGVETGAAVAFAFGPEIEAGELLVAAAVSAIGVEAFQPYPTTTRVTIAADRDELAKANGKPGSRRGERAARAFGLKHYERIKVAIALPGVPGESKDWLDVLLADGAAVVRAGILTAAPFVPAQAEREQLARGRSRAAELAEVATTYPLPAMDTIKLVYRHTDTGKIKVHKLVGWEVSPETGDREPVLVPIATPFGVTARLRYADQADSYGLRVLVEDMAGKPRSVDFDRAALAKMGAADVRAVLFAAGLRTEDDGEAIAVQCLKAADPEREIIIVRRPGWQVFAGLQAPVFICPGGTGIGVPDGVDLELSATVRVAPDAATGGTIDGWRRATEAALSVPGCPHWTIGVTVAFVGPIVGLTGLDTCGVNLSGLSTSGKSVAQRLAVSAWSTPDIRRPGLMQSARATDNAVEALAQRATGTVLALDELAHVSGKVAGKMIYTVAGGVGKRRMTSDATIRDSYSWTTFAILSGECSLEEKVKSDGGEWSAGMAVRIVDIDVTDVDRCVDGEALRRIDGIEHHFGHAGPAFVRGLIHHGLHRQAGALRERVLSAARRIADDGADSATIRAATPFALLLIGGELAKSLGLLPPTTAVKEAIAWAWQRFRQSPDATALDPERQVIGALRGWIAERWNVTIKNVDAESGNNREAVGWYDENAIYIPKARLRDAAGNGLRESQVAAILARREMLAKRTEPDRLYVRWVPKIGKVASYALRRSEFGRSDQVVDPEPHAVCESERND